MYPASLLILEEALGAVPYGGELADLERRVAARGLLEEALVGLLRVAVLLDDDPGEAGHGGVAAALRDDGVLLVAAGKPCVELVVVQELREVHATGIELHVRVLRPEEEACGIQRVRVEVREDGVDQLLHVGVEG